MNKLAELKAHSGDREPLYRTHQRSRTLHDRHFDIHQCRDHSKPLEMDCTCY
ncbi:hypothetical protein HanIR_Chr15g0748371 [Helianthus annuus]|nr:hypothetical protein HanIR_Chr15g0748371 [Helianthus annuus]